MAKDVIISCDFPSMEATLEFLDRFGDTKPYVKIGMELFYAAGPEIIKEIKKRGHKIFLDLKLCDIPNTVKSAMSVLSHLDVDMTNLHAFGGHKMMEAAIEGLTRPDGTRPLLIAVTMLTSTSKELMNEDLLSPGEVDAVVASYAKNAQMSGLDGRFIGIEDEFAEVLLGAGINGERRTCHHLKVGCSLDEMLAIEGEIASECPIVADGCLVAGDGVGEVIPI